MRFSSRRETVRLNWKPWVSRQNRETWEVGGSKFGGGRNCATKVFPLRPPRMGIWIPLSQMFYFFFLLKQNTVNAKKKVIFREYLRCPKNRKSFSWSFPMSCRKRHELTSSKGTVTKCHANFIPLIWITAVSCQTCSASLLPRIVDMSFPVLNFAITTVLKNFPSRWYICMHLKWRGIPQQLFRLQVGSEQAPSKAK